MNKNVPGRRDYMNAHAFTTTKYSSLTGEVETEKEYKYGGTLEKDKLCYYGPWEEQNEGTYKCDIKEYELQDVTEEQIKELLNNEDVSLEDILALDMKPVDSSGYITSNLTSEELSNNPYYEIIVYDEDKEDKLLKLQTKDDSFNDVAAISAGVILAGLTEIYAHITLGHCGRIYDSPYCDNMVIEDNTEKIKQLKKELNTGK